MQRQSLGSPSSKLHLLALDSPVDHQKHLNVPTISSILPNDDPEEIKKAEADELKKLIRVKNYKNGVNNTVPESYIHIIPMLTLLCFLILYMSSHDPSQNDMANFGGIIKTLSDSADIEKNISGLQSIVEIKKSDILAIRSLKDLKHRKFAQF